jgi:hypothetical protein
MDFLSNVFRSVSLGTMLLADGLFSTFTFVSLMVDPTPTDDYEKLRARVVDGYTKVYRRNILQRCLLYACAYYFTSIVFLGRSIFINSLLYLCVVPYLQNKLHPASALDKVVNEFIKRNIVISKLLLAKYTLCFIQGLDKGIHIRNYHMFIVFHYMELYVFVEAMISCVGSVAMTILSGQKRNYFYFLKVACYCKTGYKFTIQSKENALGTINNIIRNSKWGQLSKIESLHAIYTLLTSRGALSFFSIECKFELLKFLCMWNVAVTLGENLKGVFYCICLLIRMKNTHNSLSRNVLPRLVSCFLFYNLMDNTVAACLFVVMYSQWETFINDTIFFHYNYSFVCKAIKQNTPI